MIGDRSEGMSWGTYHDCKYITGVCGKSGRGKSGFYCILYKIDDHEFQAQQDFNLYDKISIFELV